MQFAVIFKKLKQKETYKVEKSNNQPVCVPFIILRKISVPFNVLPCKYFISRITLPVSARVCSDGAKFL